MSKARSGNDSAIFSTVAFSNSNQPIDKVPTIADLLTSGEIEKVNSFIISLQTKLRLVNASSNLESFLLNVNGSKRPSTALCQHTETSCTQNCIRVFIKTFMSAFVVKYLVGVLPTLLTGKIMKRPGILKQMAGRDTAEFALFLGAFTSGYNGILCALRRYRKTSDGKDSRLNSFLAGSLAGLALAFDRNKSRRQSIMLYLLIRAFQFNGGYLMKRWTMKRQRDHPGETRWDDRFAAFVSRFAPMALMGVVTGQLTYNLVMHSETISRSYRHFLDEQLNLKKSLGDKVDAMFDVFGPTINSFNNNNVSIKIPAGMSSSEYMAQNISTELAAKLPSHLHHKYVTCAFYHAIDDSCLNDKLVLFPQQFVKGLKLYGILNLFVLVLFKSRKIITDPQNVMVRFIISTIRSSMFLSSYAVLVLSGPCALKRLTGREQPWMYFASGFFSAVTVIFETHGRQMENALYCTARALESVWALALKNGHVKNVLHGDILLFMLSMGFLMPVYQHDKEVIGSTYLNVMTRLFGES